MGGTMRTARPFMRARRRSAFTLVELLVVISIIGLLASLILPAAFGALGQGRRTQCLNNIRNLGQAMVGEVSGTQRYPASGWWESSQIQDGIPTWQFNSPVQSQPVQGGGGQVDNMLYSWAFRLLSRLERSDIVDAWDTTGDLGNGGAYDAGFGQDNQQFRTNAENSDTSIRIFTCPEDITLVQDQGNLSYVVNGGLAPHWLVDASGQAPNQDNIARQNIRKCGLMFVQTSRNSQRNLSTSSHTQASIRDGVSQTVMFSENIDTGVTSSGPVFNAGMPTNWATPHPFHTSFLMNGASIGLVGTNGGEQPGQTNLQWHRANETGSFPLSQGGFGEAGGGINADVAGAFEGEFPFPNSLHAGGVHIVMCDGSVKFIQEDIDGLTWSQLVTPAGGQLVDTNAVAGQKNFFRPETQQGFLQPPLSESALE